MGQDKRLREELWDVLAVRQRNVAMRTVMPFVITAGFGPWMATVVPALVFWAILFALVSWREHRFNRRVLRRPPEAMTRAELAVIVARFVLSAVVFSLGAAVVLASRMTLSPSLAVLVAAGALLNSIVVSRRSRLAFVALNGPPFAFLLAMPWLIASRVGPMPLLPAFELGAVLLCVCGTLTWRSLSQALAAEVRATAELTRRRTEAEAEAAARAAFTATVSHELRTPLSAILAAAAALEVRALTSENRESATLITDASRLMRRLLDDLLDFSKLEAGRLEVDVADFDVEALVADTLRLWSPEATAKGLKLSLVRGSDLPRHLRGDVLRLRQVLNNLISNALKFTDAGEVRLEMEARPAGRGAWRLSLAVADTGAGLAPEEIARLFQPFEQASNAVARTHGGTGLGLAISRELARLMGGDLRAASRDDARGCRFTLDLVLPEALAPVLDPLPAPAPRAVIRVLAVDDHPLGRQALATLLGLNGYDVRLCSGAGDALGVLAESAFDLVITDLHLGDLDGRELARRLRTQNGPNQRTPLLAVSGETGAEAEASCRASGIDVLIAKPLEPRSLYLAVDAALRGASNDRDSLDASAASSFSSHSHTVNTLQPPASNAA